MLFNETKCTCRDIEGEGEISLNATKEDVSSKLFNFLFRQPLLCTESQLRETFYNQGEESFLKYIYTYIPIDLR